MSNGPKVGPKPAGGPTNIPADQTPATQPKKDEEQVKGATTSLSQQDKSQIKGAHALDGEFKRAAIADMQGDVKGKIQDATKSKADGAAGISKQEYEAIKKDFQTKSQSPETLKWMEKNHPHLHAAVTSDLDYNGYVGTTIGSLNLTRAGGELQQDAFKREQNLDKLPGISTYREDGMQTNASPGHPVVSPTAGEKWKEYKTGSNTTFIKNDALADIKDEDAKKSRETQKEFCTKMSAITGSDVSNPPSTKAAQGYFQGLANRGASPEQIKKEYGEYLKTFYRHPGGVKWDPKLDPKNLDSHFGQQPIAKDGKRLIDCEGYSALTEKVLGGIKKGDKPMFDIMHGGGPGHVFTGVFVHGGDPRKGFVVNNDQIQDVKWNPDMDKFYNQSKDHDTHMRAVVRNHWQQQFGEKSSTTEYGQNYTEMKPPLGKVPVQ